MFTKDALKSGIKIRHVRFNTAFENFINLSSKVIYILMVETVI